MEVEHEGHAGLLDFLAQGFHIVQVLAHALPLVVAGGFRGVYEEPHAHGVHAQLLEIGERGIDAVAVGVVVEGSMAGVGGQQRDIAAHILAVGHGGQCAGAEQDDK